MTSHDASNDCRESRQEADLRLRRLLAAAFFVEAGLVLLVLPWSAFWERNAVLQWSVELHELSRSPYLRGAVSGLGIVNLWFAIVEVFEGWRLSREDETASIMTPLDDARRGPA